MCVQSRWYTARFAERLTRVQLPLCAAFLNNYSPGGSLIFAVSLFLNQLEYRTNAAGAAKSERFTLAKRYFLSPPPRGDWI